MSKINAIRFINLNYNYNGIRVDDEIFHLGGASSLLSLRNGGGKSVLVQMIIAPLVHKRYRDSKDRPFAGYFTTNKPSFILIEWKLDGDAGYVLTGMMVRKNQEIREDQSQIDLDIMQFIHEYKEPNDYDIHNIPFIKIEKENKKLMNYSKCKDLLEKITSSMNHKFSLYDMNNRNSSRNYFNKLEEYKIYSKEWESIVKKINLKESGLSELFINDKDEMGLMEDWFLPAIEDKLNKGKNRIDEFRNILNRFIEQYKDNKSKIDQKHIILLFKEETKRILAVAENLKSTIDEKQNIENTIANLIVKLKNLRNHLETEKDNLIEKENLLKEEIRSIQYEKLSFDIYLLEDEKLSLFERLSQLKKNLSEFEDKRVKLIKAKSIQECSKIYSLYKDASMDVQELENKLELKKEKNKDRAPERERLGYTLKIHYENEKMCLENLIKEIEDEINLNRTTQNDLELELKKKEAEEKESIGYLSQLKTEIKAYGEFEKSFNTLYKENLNRNILDEYEDGSLELKIKNTDELVEVKGFELIRLKKQVQENKQKLQIYNRQIQEKTDEKATTSQEIKNIEEKIAEYKSEIEERKTIIRYIGLSEDKLFFKEEILDLFQKKMNEIQFTIKEVEREIEKLEKEKDSLKSGKVLELPKDFKDRLDSESIHYVYGMDWLKKNDKSIEDNKNLVENNPFIPYSLIMTSKELEKLKLQNLSIYTSFPIPIIKREDIERDFEEKKSSVYMSSKVNFYVLFNQNLLNEEELKRILLFKEEEIKAVRDTLETREEEYSLYNEKYNNIKFQKITEKSYNNILNQLKIKEKLKEEFEIQLKAIYDAELHLTNIQEKNVDFIRKSEVVIEGLKRKQIDLKKLNERYKAYLDQTKEKSRTDKRLSKIKNEKNSINDEIKSLYEKYDKTRESRLEQKSNLKTIEEKLQKYLMYSETELIQKDIEDMEARYKALTNEITSELKDIEEDLNKARNRFKAQEKDVIDTSKRLNIKEDEYIRKAYDSFILDTIIKDIVINEAELKDLNNSREELETNIAVVENKIEQGFNKLYDDLGEKELIGREQIVLREFKKRIIEKKDDLRRIKENQEKISIRLADYETNIYVLAEYDDFLVIRPVEFEHDMENLDKEGLDRFRGELLRDYRQINKKEVDFSLELSSALDNIIRNKAFKDDFFYKPLNTLFSLINDPNEFIEQLLTTIRAYDDLMAKLEVDIAFIEKEKDGVIEILLEYIRDIHKNMGEIDKNSTIKIKDKYIKMLRINLPEWDEEEYSYTIKLGDMVEHLIQSGIDRLENNENIEDLISPFITTKNLYNTVVGINNIEIKLYKIEAERQHSISWSDVAKNSGGEGFLSAFVILSSLLSFMRRDETDIFAELEEGKVLVMDNPFAQTHSSHLLTPLMDIARKSNTQLICLTGIGGESIYNCFDNIYILNLISSNLRKGTQYLTSEHTKGEEFEDMVSSQIKVEDMEQIGFLF
ncbi:coiled-coil domain-containing protein [Tissierella creatinophila]|uniref:Uncharacterized protein n=1 Tax=Tissierella creatinophila DSM 6911 TaxID=1123403 RepID=A0A1U7M7X8_TISCR|nr:hypothetical protein [Tissierella creatinophila]OLS03308.1 hypothetical protein TICRE_06460 [Tissierella creatinophila DSM 6911]